MSLPFLSVLKENRCRCLRINLQKTIKKNKYFKRTLTKIITKVN